MTQVATTNPVASATAVAAEPLATTAPDPYIAFGGTTYRFLTDCSGLSNCTQSSTPIQAAVDYFAAHTADIPVSDRTIFVDSGTYNGNVSIDGISSLAILGSSKGTTPVIDGRVTILNSVGINLSNFVVNQGVLVDASKNVALTNLAGKNTGAQPGIQVSHSDSVALTNVTSDNGIRVSNSRDVSVHDDADHAHNVGISAESVANLAVNTNGDANVAIDAHNVSGTTTVNGGAGILTLSGWLDASDLLPGGIGGAVQILGDRISLDKMLIDVSGDAGGGSVVLGGTPSGALSSVVKVSADSAIHADAITSGNGGTVTTWSNNATQFAGTVTARGGSQSGNGGAVEVSSHGAVNFAGTVDTRASHGSVGSFLIDPHNLTVATGGSDPVPGNFNLPSDAADVTISPATLQTALGSSAVTLYSNNDTRFSNDVNCSGCGNSLEIVAGRSIFIDPGVTIEINVGFLAYYNYEGATSGYRDAGTATFTMGLGSALISPNIQVYQGKYDPLNAGDIVLYNLTSQNSPAYGLYVDNATYGNGGNVTVYTATLTLAASAGLSVQSKGNVTLHDVTANKNTDKGATILTTAGSGDVLVDSSEFNENGAYGLEITSKGTITVSNVTANGNQNGNGYGAILDNTTGTGDISISASQFITNHVVGVIASSAGNITLTNVTAISNAGGLGAGLVNQLGVGKSVVVDTGTFNGNNFTGLRIRSSGPVSLSNVTADLSVTAEGVDVDNSGSGNYDVSIDPSEFSGNFDNGLIVYSSGNITLTQVTANNNQNGDGAQLHNDTFPGYNVMVDAGTFDGNKQNGLQVNSAGMISVTNTEANGNQTGKGALLDNTLDTLGTGDVSISASQFITNSGPNLMVTSKGNITLTNVTAISSTGGVGANLNNAFPSGMSVVVDNGAFDGNVGDNLDIQSSGTINLSHVTATLSIIGNGALLTNSSFGSYDVSVDPSDFSGNAGFGLKIGSLGAITLTDVTANDNKNGNGVQVTAGGPMTLTNVIANGNQNGDGALLDNSGGTGDVSISASQFITNTFANLKVTAKGNITLTNVTAISSTGGVGANLNNAFPSGMSVVVDNGAFDGNVGDNLDIQSSGTIDLSHVTATLSIIGNGALLTNSSFGSYDVSVDPSDFSGNAGFGLKIGSLGAITLTDVTANDNKNGNGVQVTAGGPMTLTNVIANGNQNGDGALLDNSGGTGDVSISASQFITNTFANLKVTAKGNITLTNVTAISSTGGVGANLNNAFPSGMSVVVDNGAFDGNVGDNLDIQSSGTIDLSHVTATLSIIGNGALLTNSSFGSYDVSVDPSDFSGNAGFGLKIGSLGAITLTDVTANDNKNGNGVQVTAGGPMTLTNVIANGNQNGDGALLDNSGGTGDVSISASQFITNTFANLKVTAKGNITLTNVTAISSTGGVGANLNNAFPSGMSVVVDNGAFDGNVGDNLDIQSSGTINLSHVTATLSIIGNGALLTNSSFGSYDVSVDPSDFSGNAGFGLKIGSLGAITLTDVTANDNKNGNGVQVTAGGPMTLTNVIANGNQNGDGALLDNSGGTGDVSISASQFITNTFANLKVTAKGNITLTNVTAISSTGGVGANLNNAFPSGMSVVVDNGAFDGNVGDNLDIQSSGTINLSHVTATLSIIGNGALLTNSSFGSYDVSVDPSDFSGNAGFGLKIGSLGAITLTDVTANDNKNGNGVQVTAGGPMTLTNVIANGNQNGDGALLDNSGGTGDVSISASQFITNTFANLKVTAKGNITLTNVTAISSTGGVGANLNNAFPSGMSVVVDNGAFDGNVGDNLDIQSSGTIDLSHVTATLSIIGNGALLTNSSFGSYDVSVDPSDFSGNAGFGLKIGSLGAITLTDVTANDNHNGNGIQVTAGGAMTLTNVTANGNHGGDGALLDNSGGLGYSINIDPSEFSGNGAYGLFVTSRGAITFTDVTANFNQNDGANLVNGGAIGYDVLIDPSTFNGNGGDGLYISSRGNITLTNVTANDNVNGYGAELSNVSATGYSIVIDPSTFNGNHLGGLLINSGGAVTLTNVTVVSSTSGSGANIKAVVTNGPVRVTCSQFTGNAASGMDIDADSGPITLDRVTSSGNGSPDAFSNAPTVLAGNCAPPTSNQSGGPVSGTGTSSGQGVTLNADVPTTLQAGCMTVVFSKGAGDAANVSTENVASLPGALPNGSSFVCGGAVNLFIKGSPVTTLPAGATLTVEFQLPASIGTQTIKILYWNGSGWVEQATTVSNGVAQTTVNFTGIFVLVAQ